MGVYTPKKEVKKESDWEVKGWVNVTKTDGTFTVKDKDNNLIGFVTKASLDKVLSGSVKGVPISLPKNFKG